MDDENPAPQRQNKKKITGKFISAGFSTKYSR